MINKYKCLEDYQGTDWFVGHVNTIEGWRELAINWADSDCSDETVEILKSLDDNEVIPYICDVWELNTVLNQCHQHETCGCKNEPVYELETTDGEIIYVCESCDEIWTNCGECEKSDIVGEGLNVCGEEYLCDKCIKKRKKELIVKAVECYIYETDRTVDYTVNDALYSALNLLGWYSLPVRYDCDGEYDKFEYEELVNKLKENLGINLEV